MPWEDDPCQAEAGSWGGGTRAGTAGQQGKKQGGKPSRNHRALGLFLICPPGQSCKSQHDTLGGTYRNLLPSRQGARGIQSSPDATWTLKPHCLEGPLLLPKQNNTKQNQWVFIWAESLWSPLQAEGKCYSPMRHCRKQVAPFRSKDSFYFWLSKMESSVCATKEWNDVWAKASFRSIHTKERI